MGELLQYQRRVYDGDQYPRPYHYYPIFPPTLNAGMYRKVGGGQAVGFGIYADPDGVEFVVRVRTDGTLYDEADPDETLQRDPVSGIELCPRHEFY